MMLEKRKNHRSMADVVDVRVSPSIQESLSSACLAPSYTQWGVGPMEWLPYRPPLFFPKIRLQQQLPNTTHTHTR